MEEMAVGPGRETRRAPEGAAGNSGSQGQEARRIRTEKGVCGPSHRGFSGTPVRAVLGESWVG